MRRKTCVDCHTKFGSDNRDSCYYYLQCLLRSIVGDQAFERAQLLVELSGNERQFKKRDDCGVLGYLMQDVLGKKFEKLAEKTTALQTTMLD